jgi:hypothetical protein
MCDYKDCQKKSSMKKTLLIGVAALFLATGTAQAFPVHNKCGETYVNTSWSKGIQGPWEIKNAKSPFIFRCNKKGKCWLNNHLCRFVDTEEYYKRFPDDN